MYRSFYCFSKNTYSVNGFRIQETDTMIVVGYDYRRDISYELCRVDDVLAFVSLFQEHDFVSSESMFQECWRHFDNIVSLLVVSHCNELTTGIQSS